MLSNLLSHTTGNIEELNTEEWNLLITKTFSSKIKIVQEAYVRHQISKNTPVPHLKINLELFPDKKPFKIHPISQNWTETSTRGSVKRSSLVHRSNHKSTQLDCIPRSTTQPELFPVRNELCSGLFVHSEVQQMLDQQNSCFVPTCLVCFRCVSICKWRKNTTNCHLKSCPRFWHCISSVVYELYGDSQLK